MIVVVLFRKFSQLMFRAATFLYQQPFSPNEANNSILYVRGPCIASMDFLVFDRWGNKVFESENLDKGWDGTYKSQPMNMGTYIWFLKATLTDGTNIDKKGNVTLLK